MKIAIAHLVGCSPYSQSRHYDKEEVPRRRGELDDEYEKRTWRNRLHVTQDGRVEIPGSSFANAVKEAAKRLSIRMKGRGTATYTKSFEAGVMVIDSVILPNQASDVPSDRLFVPADGRPGGGRRVTKFFPRIDQWEGKVKFFVFDDVISEEVFRTVLSAAGQVVGIGRFRPQNRGFYGRFTVQSLAWDDQSDAILAGAAE